MNAGRRLNLTNGWPSIESRNSEYYMPQHVESRVIGHKAIALASAVNAETLKRMLS